MPQVIIAALLGGAALNAMVALTPGAAAFPVWTTSLALQGIVIAAVSGGRGWPARNPPTRSLSDRLTGGPSTRRTTSR